MKVLSKCSRYGAVGALALGLGLVACGKKESSGSSTEAPKTKSAGEAIGLSGSLAVSSASLNLAESAAAGTIKCTYASETEDKATIGSDGSFDLKCKSGIPMVISVFDADGNPSCTLKFIVKDKGIGTASLKQDVKFGKLSCVDGEAEANLDKLAPESVSDQKLEKDSSVSIFNAEDDHWEYEVEAFAKIGSDGKKQGKSSSKKTRSSASSLALAGGEAQGQGQHDGPKKGDKFNLAFYDEDVNGNKLPDGKITVGHEEDDGYEFIEGADIVWAGKMFTINLKEEKDIKEEFAKQEIRDNRGPGMQGPQSFDTPKCDASGCQAMPAQGAGPQGPAPRLTRDELEFALNEVAASASVTFPAAPDEIKVFSIFPPEAYCASAKWKAVLNTDAAGKPCDKFDKFEFVNFSEMCKAFNDNPTFDQATQVVSVLGKRNIGACGSFMTSMGPIAGMPQQGPDRSMDRMCQKDAAGKLPELKTVLFGGNNPIEHFVQPVVHLETQLIEINAMIALAATDPDLTPVKSELEAVKKAVEESIKAVKAKFKEFEAVITAMEGKRMAWCSGDSTMTSPPNPGDIQSKIDGRALQPLFQKAQMLLEEKFFRNPKLGEARRKYMSAPVMGFDGKACTVPAAAKKFLKFDFLKPDGNCKIVSNITLSGQFKDASTIKPFFLTFMDKVEGTCSLSVKHIAFDETTGCWKWEATAAADGSIYPQVTTDAIDTSKIFENVDRQKIIGSAVKKADE